MLTQRECSFCGKQSSDVGRLIAAPSAAICDACIALCQKLLDEDPPAPPRPAETDRPATVSPDEWLAGIADTRPLTGEQELDLAERVARGDLAAKQQLVEANLPLVVSIARTYGERRLPFLDIVQEGAIGLARAVERFDQHQGVEFAQHAERWVRQAIDRAVA